MAEYINIIEERGKLMIKKRRRFYSHVVSLRHIMFNLFLLLLILITTVSLIRKTDLSMPHIPSSFLLKSLEQAIISLKTPEQKILAYSPYDLLADSILSIKASDVMNKKYAAKYGGVIKKETPADEHQPETVLGNIIETDVSAKGITFINTPGYSIDAKTLLNTPLIFKKANNAPKVLIVHTHTSEAYCESANFRNENDNMNVVSVGKEIKTALEKEGVKVIHDTTKNDNPSYNQSYKKALSVIEKNLAAYPEIEIVLDIHRDYIKRDDGSLVKPTIMMNNEKKAAQIMFVIGTDNMGLEHPNWRHNLSFAAKIQNQLNQMQPGLCRSINIRTERFNQHVTPGSMIIEVGTGVNTIQEARISGQLIGKAIASVLKTNS